ncbi:hypothetical protein BGZ61DRAFT_107460 [Ilyonectria robusta]|uniref:uncharacterized protein n=1 Tax=Ilyonectria robusta TaxID=1079257 RepID=UPI001E8EC98D|nr:uncharacterized protein BGZ61DRAFT_107460 [Ilyonectria robusta]KAH8670520.1 hypothetical protein BGZ61DRAFT_107460 [Ilyonectria robusta]
MCVPGPTSCLVYLVFVGGGSGGGHGALTGGGSGQGFVEWCSEPIMRLTVGSWFPCNDTAVVSWVRYLSGWVSKQLLQVQYYPPMLPLASCKQATKATSIKMRQPTIKETKLNGNGPG